MPVDLEKIHAEISRREEAYQAWWNALSDDRKEQYRNLKVFGSDSGNDLDYHLKICRDILDLASNLTPSEAGEAKVAGLAIHGSTPVVYFEVAGRYKRGENRDEISLRIRNGVSEFQSTFDTTPFGIKSAKRDIGETMKSMDYVLEYGVPS